MFDYFLNIYIPDTSFQIKVTKEEAAKMVEWYNGSDKSYQTSENYATTSVDDGQKYTTHFKRKNITAITVWERPRMINETKYN